MHEILTIQLGHFSNYLATHFWNAQESYFTYDGDDVSPVDHNVHWRPGLGADGSETFLPRTLIYDLKGGFGSLRRTNALYEITQPDPASQQAWKGTPVVHRQPPIAASAYQLSLDNGTVPSKLASSQVRFWSDFSRTFYHPKSIVQLYDYELSSSLMPFESWAQGKDLFGALDKDHDLIDRDFRPFAEESDRLQGIQVFTSTDDAWGGFASAYIEHLRDEYGKACVWAWGAHEPLAGADRTKRLSRTANFARTLGDISEQASIFVPLTLPRQMPHGIQIEPTSQWHVSALLESVLETATLPSRLRVTSRSPGDMMAGLAETVNSVGNRTVARLVGEVAVSATDTNSQRNTPQTADVDDTPLSFRLAHGFSVSDIPDLGSLPRNSPSRQDPVAFGQILVSRDPSIKAEVLQSQSSKEDKRHRLVGDIQLKKYDLDICVPRPDSFPEIFLSDDGSPAPEVGMKTILSTDTIVRDDVRRLRTTIHPFFPATEREGLSNRLAEIVDAYHSGWSSGSDEDDD